MNELLMLIVNNPSELSLEQKDVVLLYFAWSNFYHSFERLEKNLSKYM